MTKILITGLCLQGNKGGPALALALMGQLRQQRPDLEFVLAVPAEPEFPHEQRWSKIYDVHVVRRLSLKNIIPPFMFMQKRFSGFKEWLTEARKASAIIDMTAISYVGPPTGTLKAAVNSRFINFLFANLIGRPLIAWTQSYGPFSTLPIRLLARLDLKRQKIIFCRGEECRENVLQLIPSAHAMSFPDVATVLPYDAERGIQILTDHFGRIPDRLVTLSPSAVIYSKKSGEGALNGHVQDIVALCQALVSKGYHVLCVPHTLRPERPDLRNCDLGVCKAISDALDSMTEVCILEEDLSPIDLKSVIACAHFHIGARYHSIVAALSSGTPAISLSWHFKYRDLMQEYGQKELVFDAVGNQGIGPLIDLVELLVKDRESIRSVLVKKQDTIAAQVAKNVQLAVALLPAARIVERK